MLSFVHAGSGWVSIVVVVWVYWSLKNQLAQLELRLTKKILYLPPQKKTRDP